MGIGATTASLIGTGVSVATSAIGAISEGEARADQAEFNQAQALRQARAREQKAQTVLKRGLDRAETIEDIGKERFRRIKSRGREQRGAARAAFGASGVDIGSGTTIDVLAEQARKIELQAQDQLFQTEIAAQDQRFQTRQRARDLEVQARQDRLRAGRSGQRASSARSAGLFQAGSTLATGGFQIAQRAGAFSRSGSSFGSTSGGVAGNIPTSALRG